MSNDDLMAEDRFRLCFRSGPAVDDVVDRRVCRSVAAPVDFLFRRRADQQHQVARPMSQSFVQSRRVVQERRAGPMTAIIIIVVAVAVVQSRFEGAAQIGADMRAARHYQRVPPSARDARHSSLRQARHYRSRHQPFYPLDVVDIVYVQRPPLHHCGRVSVTLQQVVVCELGVGAAGHQGGRVLKGFDGAISQDAETSSAQDGRVLTVTRF